MYNEAVARIRYVRFPVLSNARRLNKRDRADVYARHLQSIVCAMQNMLSLSAVDQVSDLCTCIEVDPDGLHAEMRLLESQMRVERKSSMATYDSLNLEKKLDQPAFEDFFQGRKDFSTIAATTVVPVKGHFRNSHM